MVESSGEPEPGGCESRGGFLDEGMEDEDRKGKLLKLKGKLCKLRAVESDGDGPSSQRKKLKLDESSGSGSRPSESDRGAGSRSSSGSGCESSSGSQHRPIKLIQRKKFQKISNLNQKLSNFAKIREKNINDTEKEFNEVFGTKNSFEYVLLTAGRKKAPTKQDPDYNSETESHTDNRQCRQTSF